MAVGANLPFGCYQTLGNLQLKFGGAAAAGAGLLAHAGSALGGGNGGLPRRTACAFRAKHFVSAPDEVFVSRLTADKPGALSFTRRAGPAGAVRDHGGKRPTNC